MKFATALVNGITVVSGFLAGLLKLSQWRLPESGSGIQMESSTQRGQLLLALTDLCLQAFVTLIVHETALVTNFSVFD